MKKNNLRFATFLAPSFRPLYEYVAEQCGASELIDGTDWRQLANRGIDVAFVCSPPLIWLRGAVEAIAAPVLADRRFGGYPLYASDVVVNAAQPFRSLDDLKGRRWAFNEPSSWSGYWVTLARVGTWSYFGEVVAAGFHQRALKLVAEGLVDGSAIDCAVLAHALRQDPELAAVVKVVDTLGPAPSQPVVVRSDLDNRAKSRLQERLLQLRGPAMDAHGVTRYAAAPDYSQIAAVLERLQGSAASTVPATARLTAN